MIAFKNVFFRYEDHIIINNVSFEIQKGDFVAIIGSNGAGKSTLSKLCNGLLKPSSGEIFLDNLNINKQKTSYIAKNVGYLFQNPDRQICQNTIKKEILFGLNNIYKDKNMIEKKYNTIIEAFEFDETSDPFNLSRGEKQRLALACAIAGTPEILILDEPTTGLDYRECVAIMQMIKELNFDGTTIFMITHDMEIVEDYAKTVMVLDGGNILDYGCKSKIMNNLSLLEKAKVMPAQISMLALSLGDDFFGISTCKEMINQIEKLKTERMC